MMENKKVKIFFFGSGAFAVPVLEALCLNPKIQMCGIITQPDKPAGRKMALTPTPVGKWCDAHEIECRRIRSVNEPEFFELLKDCKGKVELVTSEGDRLNLKSTLCQYIALTQMFKDAQIDELDLIVSEPEDLNLLLNYLVRG